MHISGNPVPWDIHRGAAHQELFFMFHTKQPEYINWAVRMDRETHLITHISAGPLLRNQDYRNEASAVPSKHKSLARNGASGQGSEQLLMVLYWATSSSVPVGAVARAPIAAKALNAFADIPGAYHCPQHCSCFSTQTRDRAGIAKCLMRMAQDLNSTHCPMSKHEL